MGDKSKIEWTEATWNPVTGCNKVSPGCKNCYAERMAKRLQAMGQERYRNGFALTLQEDVLEQPLRWKRPRMIFVNSMSDLFHEAVPFEYIDRVFAMMALTPWHTYQILTKRTERMQRYMSDLKTNKRVAHKAGFSTGEPSDEMQWDQWPLQNVWMGVSVENHDHLYRVGDLIDTPAAVRFVSVEPMLGSVKILGYLMQGTDPGWCANCNHGHGFTRCPNYGGISMKSDRGCENFKRQNFAIHWVICGGESGPQARPMHPEWARGLRDQCQAAQVPFFFKQWGEWGPFATKAFYEDGITYGEDCGGAYGYGVVKYNDGKKTPDGRILYTARWLDPSGKSKEGQREILRRPDHKWGRDNHLEMTYVRIGKRDAGRLLDGREWNEMPEVQHG